MGHPYSAESIVEMFEAILDEWSIDSRKVKAIVTDNNSNMVKAFGNDVQQKSEVDEFDQANSDLD